MGQMYLQRFVYGEGVTKAALDQAWGEALKAFAKTGTGGASTAASRTTSHTALDGVATR